MSSVQNTGWYNEKCPYSKNIQYMGRRFIVGNTLHKKSNHNTQDIICCMYASRRSLNVLGMCARALHEARKWFSLVTFSWVPHFWLSLLKWNSTRPSWTVPLQSGLLRCKTSAENPASKSRQRDREIHPELLWQLAAKPEGQNHAYIVQ